MLTLCNHSSTLVFRFGVCESGRMVAQGQAGHPGHRNRKIMGFAACTAAGSLWGCGFFFGKIALAEMSVGHMVLYRFTFAVLGLLPLLFTHPPRFTRKEWGVLALASFLGVPVQFLLQFYGLS